jgi:outer membrane protein assembly factor BamA
VSKSAIQFGRLMQWNYRPLKIVALAAALSAVVTQGQTTQAPATAKIVSIEASGSTRLSNQEIARVSGLKLGDVVGKEQLQVAADHLAAVGIFSGVNFHYTTDTAGVHLIFDVKDATVVPVIFDNFAWASDEELSAALRQAVGFFDGNAPQQGTLLDDMASALQKFLATRGVRVIVQHTLIGWPDLEGDVVLFTATGASVNVQGVEFTDPLPMKSLPVSARLSDIIGHPYSRLSLELFAFEQIRPVYLEQGYLKVLFGAPVVSPAAAAGGGQPDSVRIKFPITPGPQFHFGGVTWSGNHAYSETSLSTMLPIAPGAIVDGNKILGAWRTIANSYGHIGYMDAEVDGQPSFDIAAGKVSYQVKITEGSQYHMGSFVVTGLSLDGEKKLRAAWGIPAGSVFDKAYFDSFYTKISHATEDVFGKLPVHYDKVGQLLRRNEQTHMIDVLLDFQ